MKKYDFLGRRIDNKMQTEEARNEGYIMVG
jgi:hypothetical protein